MFICVLLTAVCLECQAQTDSVQQPGGDVTAAEGGMVTLGCHFNSSSSNYYLFWYKQEGNNRPTFILNRFKIGTGTTSEEFKERFSSSLDSKSRSVPLKIQNLHVTDSAVYYCALQTRNQNKIIFGSGTRLTVHTKNEDKPEFYYLENPDGKPEDEGGICLATSFTRYYAVKENSENPQSFNDTNPTMITGSKGVYNQLAFLDKDGKKTCQGLSTDEPCILRPDPILNLASLTVFGLRVIFFKTVVFNVLMTLRLWSSQ